MEFYFHRLAPFRFLTDDRQGLMTFVDRPLRSSGDGNVHNIEEETIEDLSPATSTLSTNTTTTPLLPQRCAKE